MRIRSGRLLVQSNLEVYTVPVEDLLGLLVQFDQPLLLLGRYAVSEYDLDLLRDRGHSHHVARKVGLTMIHVHVVVRLRRGAAHDLARLYAEEMTGDR